MHQLSSNCSSFLSFPTIADTLSLVLRHAVFFEIFQYKSFQFLSKNFLFLVNLTVLSTTLQDHLLFDPSRQKRKSFGLRMRSSDSRHAQLQTRFTPRHGLYAASPSASAPSGAGRGGASYFWHSINLSKNVTERIFPRTDNKNEQQIPLHCLNITNIKYQYLLNKTNVSQARSRLYWKAQLSDQNAK